MFIFIVMLWLALVVAPGAANRVVAQDVTLEVVTIVENDDEDEDDDGDGDDDDEEPVNAIRVENAAVAAMPFGAHGPVSAEFMEPLVIGELLFIKQVASPDDDQLSQLTAAAKASLKPLSDIVDDDAQQQWVGGNAVLTDEGVKGLMFYGPNQERLKEEPFARVRADAAKYAKPILTVEQYSAYLAEVEKRERLERDASLDLLMTVIDHKVLLSNDQWTELRAAFDKSFKKLEYAWLRMYASNPGYAPTMRSAAMKEILTEKQMKVWGSANNTTFQVYWTQNSFMQVELEWPK